MVGCGGGGRQVKLYRPAVNHLKPHLYVVKYFICRGLESTIFDLPRTGEYNQLSGLDFKQMNVSR